SRDWSSDVCSSDLTSGQDVTVELPNGKACLAAAPDKPLLLVAAGTGFAQMKSLVEFLQETRYSHPVTLFWGVRKHEDMYLRSLAQQWHEDWSNFSFVPVVGDDEDNDWGGHHDQLVRAVLVSGADWQNVEVHASGSPTMVYTLMDALLEKGLPAQAFFSDVLEYAPRARLLGLTLSELGADGLGCNADGSCCALRAQARGIGSSGRPLSVSSPCISNLMLASSWPMWAFSRLSSARVSRLRFRRRLVSKYSRALPHSSLRRLRRPSASSSSGLFGRSFSHCSAMISCSSGWWPSS